ncbi:Uncharacterised protein [Mycobacterium tuberculosis]|nr:Uncharacterised protein [Mycobacterium tuberculosis]
MVSDDEPTECCESPPAGPAGRVWAVGSPVAPDLGGRRAGRAVAGQRAGPGRGVGLADHSGLADAARPGPVGGGRGGAGVRDFARRAALLRATGHPRHRVAGRRPGPHPYLSPAGPRTGGGRRRAAQRGPGSTRRRGRRRTGQHAGACSGADSRRSGAGSSRDRGRRGRFGASRRGTGGLPFGCRRCCALACRQNRRSAGSDRPPTSGHARHVGDDRP